MEQKSSSSFPTPFLYEAIVSSSRAGHEAALCDNGNNYGQHTTNLLSEPGRGAYEQYQSTEIASDVLKASAQENLNHCHGCIRLGPRQEALFFSN
jgi:hypothetical protein